MATSSSERLRVLVHTQVNKSTLAAVWQASRGKMNKQINRGMTKPSHRAENFCKIWATQSSVEIATHSHCTRHPVSPLFNHLKLLHLRPSPPLTFPVAFFMHSCVSTHRRWAGTETLVSVSAATQFRRVFLMYFYFISSARTTCLPWSPVPLTFSVENVKTLTQWEQVMHFP